MKQKNNKIILEVSRKINQFLGVIEDLKNREFDLGEVPKPAEKYKYFSLPKDYIFTSALDENFVMPEEYLA